MVHVSRFFHFSDINISQGSEATRLDFKALYKHCIIIIIINVLEIYC